MNNKIYTEHAGKVAEAGKRFEHVMAITLDPRSNYKDGVIRSILSREGDIFVSGSLDRSALYKIKGNDLEHFDIGEKLILKNQEEILNSMGGENKDFIGLEDPDIWIDPNTNLMHLYFTVPFRYKNKKGYSVSLGHAVGSDLDSLEMTHPVLLDNGQNSAKEVSIAPLNSDGFRYNLIESSDYINGEHYSTVRQAIAKDMGESWEYGEVVFHPAEHNIAWLGGHASPGPLFSKDFINIGENKLVGILNGREADTFIDGKKVARGVFAVGFFIYDYELGKIDWVSPEPVIVDSEARNITFASQFVETGNGEGVMYAHADDSFVRAYTLYAEGIKTLLPYDKI